jgi:hypothetical protein
MTRTISNVIRFYAGRLSPPGAAISARHLRRGGIDVHEYTSPSVAVGRVGVDIEEPMAG